MSRNRDGAAGLISFSLLYSLEMSGTHGVRSRLPSSNKVGHESHCWKGKNLQTRPSEFCCFKICPRQREVKKEQRRKASRVETQTKDGAFMSHRHRGKKRPSANGGEKKEQIRRGEEWDRVWRWQKASAGAARYCWGNLNSSAIFKSLQIGPQHTQTLTHTQIIWWWAY